MTDRNGADRNGNGQSMTDRNKAGRDKSGRENGSHGADSARGVDPFSPVSAVLARPEDRWPLPPRAPRGGLWARIAGTVPRVPAALLLSLGAHLGFLAALVWFLHAGGPGVETPDQRVMVELVMEERRGEAVPPAPVPPPAPPSTMEALAVESASPPPRAPAAGLQEMEPERETAREALPARSQQPIEGEPPPLVQQPPKDDAVEKAASAPVPEAPQPEKADEKAETPSPSPAATPAAPLAAMKITLSGTGSLSDTLAEGDQIIPAAADAVFHNRQPVYPIEAVRRGQHGAVVVVIHVSPSGRTAGADVVSSSGHVILDRAAREAMLTWRFLPAMKGGRAVASDLPVRVIFERQ